MNINKALPVWFQYPKFKWNEKQAVVIGAGVAGCQTAWHLSQQGWQVTIVERHQSIATEASGSPAGVISPKMTAKSSIGENFYRDCFEYVLNQLQHLSIPSAWHPTGLLQLAHNHREQERWASLKERNFPSDLLQLLDTNATSEIAGIPIDMKASYFPSAGWIYPRHFCTELIKNSNPTVILEKEAIHIEKRENNWHVLNKHQQEITSAEVVIVTSGKDLNNLEYTQALPSMPVAGQTTVAPCNVFSKKLKTCIGHEGYLTPASKETSQHTFGASFERNVFETQPQTKIDQQNLDQLGKFLPTLADSFNIFKSGHAAVRMTTPDRFPYVGGLADTEFYKANYQDLYLGKQWENYPAAKYQTGLFVLGGLGSRGLTTSGLCAKSLVDLLGNKPLTASENNLLQHCHPARYLIKQLKQQPKKV